VKHSLLTPVKIGDLNLENRVVMAPMTRNRAGKGNVPRELNASYYRQRASAGLVITEATQVDPTGVGYPGTPGIHSDEQVAGWQTVTEAVHEEGGQVALQLWHVGRISHPSLQPDGQLPVAPSAIKPAGQAFTARGLKDFVTPRALAGEEIPAVVAQYASAAVRAREAGFDGVEIHAANGYLIDQFLRDGTNHRTDAYGGSVENRTRFLLDVVEAVTSVWPRGRIGVRISPSGTFNDMSDSDPEAHFKYVAKALNPFGLAYLHVVEDFAGTEPFNFATLREAFRGPYMANGGYTLERANEAIDSGRADLVSFGRLFIANPDLPHRFAVGAPLSEPNESTFYGGGERGYTDYPASTDAAVAS
jgi:N-ethylmaleimide reductase